MVMLGEGGETELGTNVNFLLEEFGIALNNGSYNIYIQWNRDSIPACPREVFHFVCTVVALH